MAPHQFTCCQERLWQRAVRGHFIVESALTTLMLQAIFNFSTDDNSIPTGDDYTNLLTLYNKVSDKTINLESDSIHLLHTLNQLEIALDEYKAH